MAILAGLVIYIFYCFVGIWCTADAIRYLCERRWWRFVFRVLLMVILVICALLSLTWLFIQVATGLMGG